MQKRRYTRIKAMEAEILRMYWEGETHQAIAEVYGLEREQGKKFLSDTGKNKPCSARDKPVSLKDGHERVGSHQDKIQKQN